MNAKTPKMPRLGEEERRRTINVFPSILFFSSSLASWRLGVHTL
jgi:hypothetical protein